MSDGLVLAGAVDLFGLNVFRIVETPAGPVGVVRTEQKFYAVMNRCPHMGAPICVGTDLTSSTSAAAPFDYAIAHSNMVVRCPWHRWEFRVDTGESVGRTSNRRLLTLPVTVREQAVYVQVGRAS